MEGLPALAAVKHRIRGEVLAEVGHPSGKPDSEHVFPHNALYPAHRVRIGEVQKRHRKGGDVDQVVLPLRRFYEVVVARRFPVELALYGKEGIYVAERPHTLLPELTHELRKIRIESAIVVPVPHELTAERGEPAPFPVLRPGGRQLDPRFLGVANFPTHHIRAALHAEPHTVVHPVGKLGPRAQKPPHRLHGLLSTLMYSDDDAFRHLPAVQHDPVGAAEVEL